MEQQPCAKCGGSIREGFAAVSLDGTVTPLFWVPGLPQQAPVTKGAATKGRDRRQIVMRRCDMCGNVTIAAP
jgi:hypothetical protein